MSDTDISDDESSDKKSIIITVISLLAMAAFGFASNAVGDTEGFNYWEVLFLLSQVVVISIIIWQACDPFADAAQWVGITLKVPGSVRGATLDAVASSMPEIFTGIFFVVTVAMGTSTAAAEMNEGITATIATIAGSAVYNMLLIPAFCALFIAKYRKHEPTIQVEDEVITRDGFWFTATQVILVVFLCMDSLHWWMAFVFLGLYAVYILTLYRHTVKYRAGKAKEAVENDGDGDGAEPPEDATILFGWKDVPLNKVTVPIILIVSTVVAAGSCYWLVNVTHATAEILDIPVFFVAVILAAAASSVPDTFLSIGAAMRGDDDGAISNAFGSNIFDICICFPIPLLIECYLNKWAPIHMGDNMDGIAGLRILLGILTLVCLGIMWHKRMLNARKAWILIALYLVFMAYAIAGSMGYSLF